MFRERVDTTMIASFESEEARILFDLVLGRQRLVFSSILRKIGGYTRSDRVRRFKIGVTNDPMRRFLQAYRRLYDEMIVVYRSSSIDRVSDVEWEAVDYNRDLCDNKIGGGGGDYGYPLYFLYVVVVYR